MIMEVPKNKMKTNMYFWLGIDGELSELSFEDFEREQQKLRESEKRWRDVEDGPTENNDEGN